MVVVAIERVIERVVGRHDEIVACARGRQAAKTDLVVADATEEADEIVVSVVPLVTTWPGGVDVVSIIRRDTSGRPFEEETSRSVATGAKNVASRISGVERRVGRVVGGRSVRPRLVAVAVPDAENKSVPIELDVGQNWLRVRNFGEAPTRSEGLPGVRPSVPVAQ